MNKHLFKGFLVAAVCTVLLFLGGDAMAASKNCSLIGSWFGEAGGNTWFLIVMRGSSAKAGPLYVQWTNYDPSPDVRVSDWMGVWEKVDDRLYKSTTLFYTYDTTGAISTTNRLSGTTALADCDHAADALVWEAWVAPHDMNTDPPDFSESVTTTETRMQLVEPAGQ